MCIYKHHRTLSHKNTKKLQISPVIILDHLYNLEKNINNRLHFCTNV